MEGRALLRRTPRHGLNRCKGTVGGQIRARTGPHVHSSGRQRSAIQLQFSIRHASRDELYAYLESLPVRAEIPELWHQRLRSLGGDRYPTWQASANRALALSNLT